MKYIKSVLEFAKVRDSILKLTGDEYIDSQITKEFENDENLLSEVFIEKYDKNLNIYWFNNKKHDIVKKIKSRTSFKTVSNFNELIIKVLNYFFENHIKEILKTKMLLRYGLVLPTYNFSIILEIDYDDLFKDDGSLDIVTITNSTPKADITLFVDDENF